MIETTLTPSTTLPAFRMDWLTPARCRFGLLAFLTITLIGNVWYLHHAPIDLGGDEAQYWDWSRDLDLSYYSKGPGVAYLIRASCAIFGDTMPAVRYPAVVIHVLTLLVVYLLTQTLFGSARLALGAVLLFAMVPIVIVGSILMTIDPPMFLCWGLASYFAAIAIFDRKGWAWPLVGIAIGLGFLAKYIALVWYVGLFGYLLLRSPSPGTPGEGRGEGQERDEGRGMKDEPSRSSSFILHPSDFAQGTHPDPLPGYRERGWRAGALIAIAISILFTLPVFIWNAHHDWVSFRHVAQQTGTTGGEFSILNPLEFLAGQVGVLGPAVAWIMLAAIFQARRSGDERLKFLLWLGLPMLILNFIWSFRTKIQMNWPAPAYFTLLILTAHFLGTKLQSVQTWKPWRGWFWAAVVTGVLVIPVVRDTGPLLPVFRSIARGEDVDPLARLRGWSALGQAISRELESLGDSPFVLCDDYQQTAEAAFYVEGQPKTYCAGSYIGKRMTQYDLWPDRRLDATSPLVGRNAIYVGKGGGMPQKVRDAFDSVERLPFVEVRVNGVKVRQFTLWRCRGFKGMARPEQMTEY